MEDMDDSNQSYVFSDTSKQNKWVFSDPIREILPVKDIRTNYFDSLSKTRCQVGDIELIKCPDTNEEVKYMLKHEPDQVFNNFTQNFLKS